MINLKTLFNFGSYVFILFVNTLIVFAGSESNNSGDFVRPVIVLNYGPLVIEQIKRNPKALEVLYESGLTIEDLEKTLDIEKWKLVEGPFKDNFDSLANARLVDGVIELEEGSWNERIKTDLEKRSVEQKRLNLLVTAHEMVRLTGKNDDDYRISKHFQFKNEELPLNAVVIEEYKFDHKKEGMTLEAVKELCQVLQRRYQYKYFIVQCELHKNNWEETHEGVGVAVSSVFLGYKTHASSDYTRAIARGYNNGQFSRYQSYSMGGEAIAGSGSRSYSQVPVIGKVETPYSYTYTTNHSLYGLRVLGIGELNKLPKKVLMKSNRKNSILKNKTFDDFETALYCCNEALIQSLNSDNKFRYYRARCETVEENNGSYSYQVVTQNPFIADAMTNE